MVCGDRRTRVVVAVEPPGTESLVARIIEELEAQPEARAQLLRALLTDEFLMLPAKIDQALEDIASLKEDVTGLKDAQVETNQRLGEVESKVGSLKEETNRRLGSLEEAQVETNQRLGSLEDAQVETNQRLGSLEDAQVETNRRLGNLEDAQVETNRRLDRLQGEVSGLVGDRMESHIARNIYSIISQPLGLSHANVYKRITQDTTRDLLDPLENALDEGLIDKRQYDRILNTDIVFTARRRGGSVERVWCAVEISNTVGANDVSRAQESADALSSVVDNEILAIAAGPYITDEAQSLTQSCGVEFVRTPSLD